MWSDDITLALKNLNGIGHNQAIYQQIKLIKPNLTGDWESVVRRTIQQNSSDTKSWLGKNDIFYSVSGIGEGIWGLRDFFPLNKIIDPTIEIIDPTFATYTQPQRKEYKIQRVIRDSYMISQLKFLHKNLCQICNHSIQISANTFYSEGHHIKPLGNPHNGPDNADNILIVCANCHILCDYHLIHLYKHKLKQEGRSINQIYIDYHNNLIK